MNEPLPPVTITPYEDGPLIVRGPVEILDQSGQRIEPNRPVVALCRCSYSATKPFCDGTHKVRGFTAPSRGTRPTDPQS
ncbi:CDGSH iron-sulfur domain-containing protein [Pseudonocardiaceae bacterium YIM PH 21723]|nr:CDGSH iron-sulfur domain-containing protein [Pseudonocardiaceae bacterium YIM PH 21723]